MLILFRLFLAFFFVLFVGRAIAPFQQAEVIPTGRSLLVITSLLLLISFRLVNPVEIRAIQRAWSRNSGIILAFLGLVLYYGLLLVLAPNYATESKDPEIMMAQPALRLIELVLAIALGAIIALKFDLKPYCAIALAVLSGSIIVHTLWPSLYHSLVGETLPWAAGFGVNRNASASAVLFICSLTLDYRNFKVSDMFWITVSGIAVLLTMSRGGIIKLAVLGILYVFYQMRRGGRKILVTMSAVIFALSIAMIVFLNVALESELFQTHYAQERLEGLESWEFRSEEREGLVTHSLEAFAQAPIAGHGYFFHLSSEFGGLGPHNEYLRHALDGGIVALTLFLLATVYGLRCFASRGMRSGVVFMILVLMDCFFSHNMLEDTTFVLLYGAALGFSATKPALESQFTLNHQQRYSAPQETTIG